MSAAVRCGYGVTRTQRPTDGTRDALRSNGRYQPGGFGGGATSIVSAPVPLITS